METIKAVGYVRVSTDTQAREGAGLDAQRAAINAFVEYRAKTDGWELGEIFVDAGVSGAKTTRPAFDKMMAGARAGDFNVIVCYKTDRLGRSAVFLLNTVTELDALGVHVVTTADNINTADTGAARMWLTILAGMAEFEREMIRERMLGGKAVKQAAGAFYEGSTPYGYKYAGGFKFVADPKQAPVLKRIVAMYVDNGTSAAKIAAKLRGEGVKRISATSVGRMVKNPVYYTGRMKRTGYNGEELVYTLPPLITAGQWERMQARTKRNKHRAKRGGMAGGFWLRDSLRCARCGDVLKPRVVRNNGKEYAYYACVSKTCSNAQLQLRDRTRCRLPYIPAADIEREVWYHIIKRLTFGDNKQRLAAIADPERWTSRVRELDRMVAGVRGNIERKQMAKARLFDMLEEPDFKRADFTDRLNGLDEEIAGLEAKLAEHVAQRAKVLEAQNNDQIWADLAADGPEILEALARQIGLLDAEAKKYLVEAMLTGPIMVDGEPNVKRGKPGTWALSNLPKHINIGALVELADAGRLPALKTAGRKQRFLITTAWQCAA